MSEPSLARIAVIGALVVALGLAGCGRKGGLDAPPDAAVAEQNGQPAGQGAGVGPEGRAMAPTEGPKRRTPIDWLID